MTSRTHRISTTLFLFGLLGLGGFADVATAQNHPKGYAITDVMVPTRDGVHLNTKIIAPDDSDEPLPIILLRTPYGIEGSVGDFVTRLKTLADEGYIFVFQDIPGKFASEGDFVMLRPAQLVSSSAGNSIDEATDTYDSIEWLLDHIPNNNGRVGMMGTSRAGSPCLPIF